MFIFSCHFISDIYFFGLFCLLVEEGMDRLKLWLMDNPAHTNEDLLEELRSIQTFASLRPADRAIIYLGM